MFPTPTPDANVIRYRVLFRTHHVRSSAANAQTHSPDDEEADRGFVIARRELYAAFVAHQVGDFIWHKHAMHLTVARTAPSSPLLRSYCLEGETSVGDAIDDEWVVTWLLFQLTTQFPDDDALVQVADTDGEFLLIECADALPEWVTPENSAHRVFVRRGELHLVSVNFVPEVELLVREELQAAVHSKKEKIKNNSKQRMTHEHRVFTESVRAVLDDRVATRANAVMQRTLEQKLAEAPRYMLANRHRVRCVLPPKAAWVLQKRPDIVGAAVEAFYYREPRQATAVCGHMTVFPPRGCVAQMVTMSRCQYAQLKQQQFFPPKPFLHLPGVDSLVSNEGSRVHRATEVGVKLACGLELLYATDELDQFGTEWKALIDEACVIYSDSSMELVNATEPDDDDSWLYVHPDSLEQKLQQVAARTTRPNDNDGDGSNLAGGAEELQSIATMFNDFMGGVSGVDGVEASEPVNFDMAAFMSLLNGETTAQKATSPSAACESMKDDDEEWDDPEDDDSDGSSVDSDDELEHEPEDAEDRILREAMAEMDAELGKSTLAKTFARVQEAVPQKAGADRESIDPNLENKPLDLDFNLLSNLLESMASQEGLAGPVTNILNELAASSSR